MFQLDAAEVCTHVVLCYVRQLNCGLQELPLELYLSEKCGAVCVAKLDPCYLCLPEVEG